MSKPMAQVEKLMELRDSVEVEGCIAYVMPPTLIRYLQQMGGSTHVDKDLRRYVTHPKHPNCRFYKSTPLTR